MSEQQQKCNDCKYWNKTLWQEERVVKLGTCRRFPEYVNRIEDDWCGEWAGQNTGKL